MCVQGPISAYWATDVVSYVVRPKHTCDVRLGKVKTEAGEVLVLAGVLSIRSQGSEVVLLLSSVPLAWTVVALRRSVAGGSALSLAPHLGRYSALSSSFLQRSQRQSRYVSHNDTSGNTPDDTA